MSIKVKMYFRLAGKSYKEIKVDGEKKSIYVAEDAVESQFGDRPLFISQKYIDEKYPKMFSAAWLISDQRTDGTEGNSELVVLAHGDTMEEANNNMLKSVKNADWFSNARNI